MELLKPPKGVGRCECVSPKSDHQRALNTVRYIHANPKAAGMQEGFFYDFSNYGVYDRLEDDGLTTSHPAFLTLGKTLNKCAAKYRFFCKKYKPKAKTEKHYSWGNQFLPKVIKGKCKKVSPGQMRLPWDSWETSNPEIVDVAEKFIFANCYNSQVAGMIFRDHSQ